MLNESFQLESGKLPSESSNFMPPEMIYQGDMS